MDNDNISDEQKREELSRCHQDFAYFVREYVKIIHPKRGLIPLEVYPYQERLWRHYENNRFTILTKFRQGGFTTLTLVYAIWKCMFQLDQRILYLAKTDRECWDEAKHQIVDRVLKWLPEWLKPELGRNNDHHIEFAETNSEITFLTPQAARGKACSLLILNEAAFIPSMDKHWKAVYPTIACGDNVIALSTPNGIGNWFEETYHNALSKKNAFSVFESDYKEHPDFNNPDWCRMMKENLGDAGWHQEVLQCFIVPE